MWVNKRHIREKHFKKAKLSTSTLVPKMRDAGPSILMYVVGLKLGSVALFLFFKAMESHFEGSCTKAAKNDYVKYLNCNSYHFQTKLFSLKFIISATL